MADCIEIDSDSDILIEPSSSYPEKDTNQYYIGVKKNFFNKNGVVSSFRKEIRFDKKDQLQSFLTSNKKNITNDQIKNSHNDSSIFNFDSECSDNCSTEAKTTPLKQNSQEIQTYNNSRMYSSISEDNQQLAQTQNFQFGIDDQIRMSQHYSKCMATCEMIPSLLSIWLSLIHKLLKLLLIYGPIIWCIHLFYLEYNRRLETEFEIIQKGANECSISYEINKCDVQLPDSEIYQDCLKLFHCKISNTIHSMLPIKILSEFLATILNEFFDILTWTSLFKILVSLTLCALGVFFYAKYLQMIRKK